MTDSTIELSWLSVIAGRWREEAAAARLPHAVLLNGPPGTGKRALAAWMAAGKLGAPLEGLPTHPAVWPVLADFHRLGLPEDKASIGIDQVRELVTELALTSYEGAGKAAVIEPADRMTHAAANSLLKTLEEPPGNTLIVLITDRAGRLPVTIASRCRALECAAPPPEVGLEWLNRLRPAEDWLAALAAAGYAPLAAERMLGDLDAQSVLARDLNAVGEGGASPVEVASRWSKSNTGATLTWLARQVAAGVRSRYAVGSRPAGLQISESVLQRMDSRNLFCYLDSINRLRALPKGAYNEQLAFENLLIDWSTGLRNLPDDESLDGVRALQAGR